MTRLGRIAIIRCAVFVFITGVLTGCGEDRLSDRNDSYDTGGIRIGMTAAPRSLDPRIATDVASARIQQLMYNSLVRLNRQSEIVPDIAESWTMTDDTTYRFVLRRDIRFHDGSLLTANDVKATFDAVLSDSLASPRKAAYDKLESITIIDDHTIEFTTTEPFAPFLVNMVMGILPAHQADIHDPAVAVLPIGTGPFQVTGRVRDDRITLTAFDDHFNGRPIPNMLEFRVIPDDTIRVMELEKGSIDFVQNDIPPDALKRLHNHRDLTVTSAPGTSYFYLGFNFRLADHPTAHRDVRHALAMALDRDQIITHIMGGLATKAVGVLPENHWAFDDTIDMIPFDPVQAGRLLDKAGYPLVNGSRFNVEFKVSQNKHSIRLAEVIQAQWGVVGVHVTLRSLEWGTFYEDIISGNFETFVMSWVGVTDPDIYHSLFHSDSAPPDGRNRGQYSNPEMDIILDRARIEMNPDQRAQDYRRVQQIAAHDLPYISLWHTHNVAAMKTDLQNFHFYPAGDLDSLSRVNWRRD
jgi:peptide/nickel transport system substrate-binding protein